MPVLSKAKIATAACGGNRETFGAAASRADDLPSWPRTLGTAGKPFSAIYLFQDIHIFPLLLAASPVFCAEAGRIQQKENKQSSITGVYLMSNVKMFCDALPNIPWQEKPADITAPGVAAENPIIDATPAEGVAR